MSAQGLIKFSFRRMFEEERCDVNNGSARRRVYTPALARAVAKPIS
jgi:hypothetical protein